MLVPKTPKEFRANHFVPLVPKDLCVNITAVNFIDLGCPSNSERLDGSDSEGKSFMFRAPLDASDVVLESQTTPDSLQESFGPVEFDECQASIDQADYGGCQNAVTTESPELEADSSQESVNMDCTDISQDSADMDSDDSLGGKLQGGFLEMNALIRLLQQSIRCLEQVPTGLKENVYFVVRNDHNFDSRKNGGRSRFSDDCGVWKGSKGGSPISRFLILPSGELKGVVKRDGTGYCLKRKVKGQYQYVQLNPQPLDNETVELHRYYTKLKKDQAYKKKGFMVKFRWG